MVRKGRKQSEETKKKRSDALKGRKQSESTRDKIGNGNAKNTYKVTRPNGQVDIIKNLTKYCRENGLNPSLLCAVSKCKRRHHKRFICEKLNG